MKDTRSGYMVPEHYFDDLKGSIKYRVSDPFESSVSAGVNTSTTWRMAFGRMGAFAAGFLLLVALSGTVFYFTANRVQRGETVDRVQEICMLYNVDEDDILDYSISPTFSDSTLLAEVAISYVELYGYPVE